jgi:tetratricopeptide (TPR) repeat protein
MIAAALLLALAVGVQSAPHPAPASPGKAGDASFAAVATAAVQAWKENRDADATRLLKQGLKLHPQWDDGLWYLGTLQYDHEDFRAARDLLRHYLALHPDKGAGWALTGMCDYKLREFDHASEDLHRALASDLRENPELAGSAEYYTALLLTRQEHFQDSAAILYELHRNERGLHVNAPLEVPLGLAALGYALLPEEAPADRLEMIRQTGAGVFARFEQDRQSARRIFTELLQHFPDEAGLHLQYGMVLLEDKDAGAIAELEKAQQLAPSNPEARLALADHYLEEGQTSKAQESIDAALAIEPKLAGAHLLKGRILEKTGALNDAIAQYESARQLAPGDSRILWALLRACRNAGRKEEAAQLEEEIRKSGAWKSSNQ